MSHGPPIQQRGTGRNCRARQDAMPCLVVTSAFRRRPVVPLCPLGIASRGAKLIRLPRALGGFLGCFELRARHRRVRWLRRTSGIPSLAIGLVECLGVLGLLLVIRGFRLVEAHIGSLILPLEAVFGALFAFLFFISDYLIAINTEEVRMHLAKGACLSLLIDAKLTDILPDCAKRFGALGVFVDYN